MLSAGEIHDTAAGEPRGGARASGIRDIESCAVDSGVSALPVDLLVRVRDGQLCLERARALAHLRTTPGADATVELSPEERHVIEHSLGIAQTGREYRNHFCASEGHHDWSTLQDLCELGLMRIYRAPTYLSGGDTVFLVTGAGKAAIERARSEGKG